MRFSGQRRRVALAAALAGVALALTGCGGNSNGAQPNQTSPGPPLPSGVTATTSPTQAPSGPTQGGPAQGGS